MDVSRVVYRRARRDLLDFLVWNCVGNRPRPGRVICHEPDTRIDRVEFAVDQQDLSSRVGGIANLSTIDLFEFRFAVILYFQACLAALNSRRPNSLLLRTFFDAKAAEIASVFSGGTITDNRELKALLQKLAPIQIGLVPPHCV